MTKPVPLPGLLEIDPYKPGKATGHAGPVFKLSSNESALGASPKALAAYAAAGNALERYPDGDATQLRETIAQTHGLPANHVVVGAGSDEIIQLLLRGYAGPGDNIVQSRHGFSYYHLAAQAAGVRTLYADEDDLVINIDRVLEVVTAQTKLVFLANPNNPTGTVLMGDALRQLRAQLPPHIILVLDGAYAEYMDTPAYTDGADMVGAAIAAGADNVVMMRTFSKIYGLGGMRVGWAYAPADIIAVLNRIRGPFNVNAPALQAAAAAMADQDFVDQNRAHNKTERARVAAGLAALGYQVTPSHGNFVLFAASADPASGPATAQDILAFLEGQGVLIRAAASAQLPGHLRASIGSVAANDAFLQGMAAFAAR